MRNRLGQDKDLASCVDSKSWKRENEIKTCIFIQKKKNVFKEIENNVEIKKLLVEWSLTISFLVSDDSHVPFQGPQGRLSQ